MWLLQLNPVRSRYETLNIVGLAETREELLRWVEGEKAPEPYQDGQWQKVFKRGSPLEWYNPMDERSFLYWPSEAEAVEKARYEYRVQAERLLQYVIPGAKVELATLPPDRWRKQTRYMGQPRLLVCDGRCDKAWGILARPREFFDPKDEDDFAYLTDSELGSAPANPGNYEGGDGKPEDARGYYDMNKWCARQCERSQLLAFGEKEKLPDLSKRLYNQPWKHKPPPWCSGCMASHDPCQ